MFYLSTLAPLNIVAAALPGPGAALRLRLHPAGARAALRAGGALPRRPARHDDARPRPAETRRRRRSRTWISEFESVGRRPQRRPRRHRPADVRDARDGRLARLLPRRHRGTQQQRDCADNSPGFDAQAVRVRGRLRAARLGPGDARSSTRRSASPTATRSSRRATRAATSRGRSASATRSATR